MPRPGPGIPEDQDRPSRSARYGHDQKSFVGTAVPPQWHAHVQKPGAKIGTPWDFSLRKGPGQNLHQQELPPKVRFKTSPGPDGNALKRRKIMTGTDDHDRFVMIAGNGLYRYRRPLVRNTDTRRAGQWLSKPFRSVATCPVDSIEIISEVQKALCRVGRIVKSRRRHSAP